MIRSRNKSDEVYFVRIASDKASDESEDLIEKDDEGSADSFNPELDEKRMLSNDFG